MTGGNESNPQWGASTQRYALVAVAALVVASVVPWVGAAFADGSESARNELSTIGSAIPDPINETDEETNDSTEVPLPTTTETTTESDDPPADSPADPPGELPRPGDPVPNGTPGDGPGDDGDEPGPPNENAPPVNGSDPPANRTGPPANGTSPPANGTALPANATGVLNATGPANGTPGVGPGDSNRSANATTVNVTVENATANEPVSVNVSRPERRNDSTAFDSVAVTPAKNGSFTLNTTASDEPIADRTPTTDLPNGTQSLGFLSVNHSIDDENVTEVTFTFRVRKDRVNASERDDVVLYRFKNGSWNELPTTHVATTDSHYVYRVRSPGLSEFAAGKQTAQFEITNASVEVRTLSVGDALKVRVRITNEGDADGTFTAELVLGNDPVASRHLTIAAGGMRQTTFERTVSQPGTYEVYVNDYRVGEVTVNGTVGTDRESASPRTSDEGADTENAETDATDRANDGASSDAPGFGVPTAVATLLGALLAIRWRKR
jgi:PGF-pre-PGF domain-containing protein/PGF-CTERM protein